MNGLTERRQIIAVGTYAIALAQVWLQYISVVVGDGELFFDARRVWIPLAEAVVNGQALYLGAAADNKPPLFLYLNQLVYATGQYEFVFFTLVGLANGTTAVLLIRWFRSSGRPRAGVISALFFLAALPVVNGDIIGVRPFALVALLATLFSSSAVVRGVGVAIAGLFIQYAVLAAPVVAYQGIQDSDHHVRWLARFVVSGVAVAAISYLTVFIIWGPDSLVAGVEQTVLIASSYVAEQPVRSPLHNSLAYAQALVIVARNLIYLLVPATVLVAWRLWSGDGFSQAEFVLASLSVLLLLPLAIKSLLYYWVLPLPFVAGLAGIALSDWFD